jgi:hypothetical protein
LVAALEALSGVGVALQLNPGLAHLYFQYFSGN